MFVSGHEDWDAMEIASKLMGDEITPGDIDGLHGAVIVLCKRVAELEGEVTSIRNRVAAQANTLNGPPD